MKRYYFNRLWVFLLLCISGRISAQTDLIASLPLSNKQSILNDRAFFMFPASAENLARETNLMAADPNTNRETRIVLDVKNMRMVFFAQELYSTSGENLLAFVAKDDRHDFKSRLLSGSDSLVSVLSTPLFFDTTETAILVNTLLVKTADNSIFRISAYITPGAFKEKEAFQKLSEHVFSTLSKGTRCLNTKARTETWPIYGGAKKFSIRVPEGYVITKDAKYDFEVLKIHKMTEMGDTSLTSLIIYTGHHPSYFYQEEGFSENQAEKVKGSFLDKKTDWLYFKNSAKALYIKEQLIPFDKISKGTILHVAMIADRAQTIEELSSIVTNMKLTK